MKLFRAEMTRLMRRQASVWLLLATLGLVAIFAISAWQINHPPSAAELARQERAYEEAAAEWEAHGEEQKAACYADEARAKASGDSKADFGCQYMTAPDRHGFVWQPPVLSPQLRSMSHIPAPLFGLISLTLGATLVGAEIASGSMSTWLTFEPRRRRVFASKLAASGVGGLLVGIVGVGLTLCVTWAAAALHGSPGGFKPGDVSTIIGQGVRSVVIITTLALAGSAGAFLVRHTAAVVGAALAYTLAFENILALVFHWLPRWTLSTNVSAFIEGRTTYPVRECLQNAHGDLICTSRDMVLTWHQATPYLFGLVALLIAAGYLAFRRRDVN